jgi:hypothetical protein
VKPALALVALAIFSALAPASAIAARLEGVVVDALGRPIEFATIAVPAHRTGVTADERGAFTIVLPAGQVVLQVAQLGYRSARLEVALPETGASVRVTLEDEPVPLAEVSVQASTFGGGEDSEGPVVRRLDIYTTPGGAGDVFQALRALPGINAPNEGAALFVRGGDPRETVVRVDGGSYGHPYHYEGASGGLFSAFDTYMLKSALFSSGGFGARYGGALSGVLDIETQDPFDLRTVTTGVNLVGAGVSSSWALVPGRLSFVGTSRYSNIEMLDQLFPSDSRYLAMPSSADGAARLIGRYSPSGRLALTHLASTDRVGVVANALNFEGEYRRRATNAFTALQGSDVIAGRIAIRAQAAFQRYGSRWTYGPGALEREERNGHVNMDAVWPLGDRHELSFGGSWERRDARITGRSPADSTDFGPGAPTRTLGTRARTDFPGFYVEDKLRVWGPLFATVGGRLDWSSVPGVWTADPRAALAWRVDERQTVRVAAGRYHQPADVEYLDPRFGNPRLDPPRADHVIAGYEWKSEAGTIRVEGYRKDYHQLVTHDTGRWYANEGTGYARGVDAFVQGSVKWLSGWVSYGWLDSRRRELDDAEEVPSRYGVRHTLTVVGQYQLASSWQVGMRAGFSTGRPYTPVVDRTYDPARAIWRPVFGAHQSDEMPDYRRVDVRLTKLFSLPALGSIPESGVCVFYVEVLNVLDDRNVLDWVYNDDYSSRYANESYFSRRLAVAGFSLSW